MSEKIRIVVAKNNKDSLNVTKKLLDSFEEIKVIGETCNAKDILNMILEFHPDIIIMDSSMDLIEDMKISTMVNGILPYIGIIFVGSIESIDVIRAAMQSGASDFLQPPITSSKLYDSIMTIYKVKHNQKKQLMKSPLVISQKDSKIITVFSSKGGVGKTFLSTNVAIGLSNQTREEVLLIDLDLQFGDVVDMFDIVPKASIIDLVNDKDASEQKEINKYIISHYSGIKILAAPHDAEQADQITKTDFKTLIPRFTKTFDYIVIDLPPIFNQITLAAIEDSDYLLLLTTMEIPTLKNVKESLDILRKVGFAEEKIFIIVNRYFKNSDIKISDIKKFLGINKFFSIDDCPDLVSTSINAGEPVVLKYKSSEIVSQIFKICHALIDDKDLSKHNNKKPLLSRFLKRVNSKNE